MGKSLMKNPGKVLDIDLDTYVCSQSDKTRTKLKKLGYTCLEESGHLKIIRTFKKKKPISKNILSLNLFYQV